MNKKRLTLKDLEGRYAVFCANKAALESRMQWDGGKRLVKGRVTLALTSDGERYNQ